jgi:hypothetical protein
MNLSNLSSIFFDRRFSLLQREANATRAAQAAETEQTLFSFL